MYETTPDGVHRSAAPIGLTQTTSTATWNDVPATRWALARIERHRRPDFALACEVLLGLRRQLLTFDLQPSTRRHRRRYDRLAIAWASGFTSTGTTKSVAMSSAWANILR